MSQRFPHASFTGIDINDDLVAYGNTFIRDHSVSRCTLDTGDIYNLDDKYIGQFDGITMFQTLNGLPDFKSPLQAIIKLAPHWIGITSLAYDGLVSCTIAVTEYDNSLDIYRESYYNVYSLHILKKFIQDNGYPHVYTTPFEIDIDIAKPDDTLMTTYTTTLHDSHRLQISGPLLMPWYFIVAKK
jgi:hypothetical protein